MSDEILIQNPAEETPAETVIRPTVAEAAGAFAPAEEHPPSKRRQPPRSLS